ncbi:threonine synthase [Ruficoccus amylovorans]|uniref:Threonine synthase n=1 Tax=Ruficoccus amylovorans TaxID=1804625 RepID=A0A842HF38_9BACT|nr:threonine synthase [Ruficoccus amylovorans]MBC2594187.1 threonine synthase [Ruficoccus amylovorans]
MEYVSTRGNGGSVTFTQAVAAGLAPDGGLYLPRELPDLSGKLDAWEDLGYAELCFEFLKEFATDMDEAVLRRLVEESYKRFTDEKIAPLVGLSDDLYVLELFHGPTLAFKDFALQLVGNLYEEQIRNSSEHINVLGATSGDTGSAAIHGLLGKDGVNIFILYPDGRISPLQERQMTTTGAANVFPLAVKGSFDDAQHIVKELFGDLDLKRQYRLSAINSINLARILAQCVYYFYAYFQLPKERRGAVEFIVPTGNFGNILAGWLAKRMGLPAASFRVATNQNDILYKLFTSGQYEVGDVVPSLAPSMDIQVASNFERFLYYLVGCDPQKVRSVMGEFRDNGRYQFESFDADVFTASHTTDAGIREIIAEVYKKYGYVVDPHTACGFVERDPAKTAVVLATAHPAKFPETITEAIGIEPTAPALEELKAKTIVRHELPAEIDDIRAFIEEHAQL